MHLHHLTSVDGEIVIDLDPDVVGGATGRVYVRDGVTVDDAALLARAATFRAALFEARVAGAAVTIRPRLIDSVDETLDRLRAEIAPLEEAETVLLADEPASPAAGIVAAMDAWFGGLAGRTVAIHGFGPLGAEIARAVVSRDGRVVGLSNPIGAVAAGRGLDLDQIDEASAASGDRFVTEIGLEVHLPDELLGLSVDALVIGGGVGSVDAELAARIDAGIVVPMADALYAQQGLDELRRRRIVALPDVATTAGPMLEALAPRGLSATETSARAARLIAERIDGARRSKVDPHRYTTALADTFLTTWIPSEIRPTAPGIRQEPSIP